ncbi:hypothetical protein BDV3_002740 [Batrachochytrium dendrobatidis]
MNTVAESYPTSRPLKSMDHLDDWTPLQDPFGRCTLPLQQRCIQRLNKAAHYQSALQNCNSINATNIKKVAVCHDMCGGYDIHQDALIQGNYGLINDVHQPIYTIQYWQYIDEFIYFSHARFSIPPVVWIIAAHRNGVKVYATFITEWEDGILETMKLIYGPAYTPDSPNSAMKFSPHYADKMVELALYFGFEGWFINIESDLSSPLHAETMAHFLSYLTAQMHSRVPGGQVMFYDSLTRSGKVDWQDGLTNENKMFFDACDSLFTNYTWKQEGPCNSAELASSHGQSPSRIYTGIDVWGRKTYGGGGFNVHKALKVIQSAGTSCALFAPGWTYEYMRKTPFKQVEERFWCNVDVDVIDPEQTNSIAEQKTMDPDWVKDANELKPVEIKKRGTMIDADDVGCVADYISPRPAACQSILYNSPLIEPLQWFYSCFDQGFGTNYSIHGKAVFNASWSHIASQSVPPTHRTKTSRYIVKCPILPLPLHSKTVQPPSTVVERIAFQNIPGSTQTSDVVTGNAWLGGSILKLQATLSFTELHPQSSSHHTVTGYLFQVFDLDMDLQSKVYVRVRYTMDFTSDCLPLQNKFDNDGMLALSIHHPHYGTRLIYATETHKLQVDALLWHTTVFQIGDGVIPSSKQTCPFTLGVVMIPFKTPLMEHANFAHECCMTVQVGEIFISPLFPLLTVDMASESIQTRSITVNNAQVSTDSRHMWMTITWEYDIRVEETFTQIPYMGRCEVFMDGTYLGSAFIGMYRISIPLDLSNADYCQIRVVGIDASGNTRYTATELITIPFIQTKCIEYSRVSCCDEQSVKH